MYSLWPHGTARTAGVVLVLFVALLTLAATPAAAAQPGGGGEQPLASGHSPAEAVLVGDRLVRAATADQTGFDVNQTVISQYDADDDGSISASELNVAISDWAAAQIQTGDLRDVSIAYARTDEGSTSMDVTRTVERSTVAPGETTNVTLTVTGTGDSAVTISERVDSSIAGVSIESVTVDGQDATPLFSHADEGGVLVVLTPPSNATVEVNYRVTANATAGTTHTVSGGAVSSDRESWTSDAIEVRETSQSFDVNQTVVSQYDADDDGSISASELNVAISDWAAAQIQTGDLRDVSIAYARGGSGPAGMDVTRTVERSTVAPGETTNVTLTVTGTGDSALTVTEQFDLPVDGVHVTSVTVDGQDATPLFSHADEGGVLAVLTPPSNATVEVNYRVTANATSGTTHVIDGGAVSGDREVRTNETVAVEDTASGPFDGVAARYNTDGNAVIDISELGAAAADYAIGDISIAELGEVAAAYVRG